MKKFLLFLVAATLATVARAYTGQTFTYQGLNFEVTSEDDHTVKVGRYNDVSGDISIPSFAVNGSSRYFVTEIGEGAFQGRSSLTSVTIPNSITEIGEAAFYGCKSLTSVNLPDALTEIRNLVFSQCESLTSVSIPNSVTKIGQEAFFFCRRLTSVSIPNSVTEIGVFAFNYCDNLTSVSIPNSVTEIGSGAFSDCNSLTSVNIPDALTEIRSGVFERCRSLTSISIPNSVTKIEESAFSQCESLTSISIPNSVTKIEESAFSQCESLTSISIPNSVTEIGTSAFQWCSSMTEIVVENGNPNYSSEDGVLFNINKTELIKYPNGKEGEYSIPTSVNKICDDAFSSCSSLTSVYIPNSVTAIGTSAFSGCCLTSVYIPNSVTEIGTSAFQWCSSLTSVYIPNSVTTIRKATFSWCEKLKTIYNLNPTPQSVEKGAFDLVPEDAIIYIPKGSYNDYFLSSDWIHFSDFREMGAFDVALSEQSIELTAGNTATVTATVTKDDDMTVESEEWSSSNPEVATVDNGVITAVAPGEAVIRFTAVAANGLICTESCTVTVSQSSGVVEIVTDTDAPVDVYNLQGVAVLRNAAATELGNLPAALYIVRQGKSVKKIIVK